MLELKHPPPNSCCGSRFRRAYSICYLIIKQFDNDASEYETPSGLDCLYISGEFQMHRNLIYLGEILSLHSLSLRCGFNVQYELTNTFTTILGPWDTHGTKHGLYPEGLHLLNREY